MAVRKALPPQTVKNLIPPAEEYRYFEDAAGNPFRADADALDRTNAGWLSDAAMLVYDDEAFIRAHAAHVPGAQVRAFAGESTQALALHTGAFVIVAFRG